MNRRIFVNVFLRKGLTTEFSVEDVMLTKHTTESVANSEFFELFNKQGHFVVPINIARGVRSGGQHSTGL